MTPRLRYALEVAAVLAACAFFFFYGLGSLGLAGADEPRYAQVAREMLRSNDYITPTLHGEPWLEKPALYYWRAAAAFRTFGVHDWAARLPSATFSLTLVVLIYFHMRRFRPGAELDAALITASAAAIFGFARGASTDMQLAAPFALAMLGWYAWYETGRKFWLFDLYFFLAVGTLAKGPVAPGMAGLIVLIFAAIRRDWKIAWRTLWLPGIAMYCAIALPWYVMVQVENPQFLRVFFLEHNLERFATNLFQHRQPFWYYLPVLLLSLMPWTVYAVAALVNGARDTWNDWRRSSKGIARESAGTGDAFDEFLVIWALVPVFFFSLSQSKLPGYILPAIPACTILSADYLKQLRRRATIGKGMLAAHSLMTGILPAAALLVPNVLVFGKSVPADAAGVAALAAIATSTLVFLTVRQRGMAWLRTATLVPVVLSVFFLLHDAGGILDRAYSARNIESYLELKERNDLPTGFRPVAVFDVRRDVEYGLGFYRDQKVSRYERDGVPATEHLLVAHTGMERELAEKLKSRLFIDLGPPGGEQFDLQHVEVYWVSSSLQRKR